MKLYIKNMVCNRCILVVENILTDINIIPKNVRLGEVDFGDLILNHTQIEQFREKLNPLGFEILDNKTSQLVEKVKKLILKHINSIPNENDKKSLSNTLREELSYDYNYISNLYSSITGETMEQYQINLKIEKIKELLLYDELTISEISYQLGYSSSGHLSSQFKKVIGLTPSYFKKIRDNKGRIPIDNL